MIVIMEPTGKSVVPVIKGVEEFVSRPEVIAIIGPVRSTITD